jgi:formylglycine-generating enzyme
MMRSLAISSVAPLSILLAVAAGPSLSEMVLIPGGCFDLGPRDEPFPVATRRVCLKDFYLDRSEVTVSAYGRCLQAGKCSSPKTGPRNKFQRAQATGLYPVVGVYWWQARDYCRWTGKRLPTYDEWERAARGPKLTTYPWGDSPPTTRHVDFKRLDEFALGLRPVCTKPLGNSPEGLCDMADNAPEYVGTGLINSSIGKSAIRNIESAADEKGTGKIVMGKLGSKYVREAWELSITGDNGSPDFIGFRCASDRPEADGGVE